MSCILILLVVGVALNRILDRLEERLLQWRPETKLSLDVERKGS
ncbi:hypothetical protein SDC9_210316 [bioreactor metagenome]|uniref:Uncharacterized protein n=1 Tax=bioreactor metagenome TaxID=1076179 RepID=A0A645JGT7_9ZZZZ